MKAPRSLGVRIALTVLPVIALYVANAYVTAPGISDPALLHKMQTDSGVGTAPILGLFSIGVLAWVQAYIFVELVSLAVPALRRLRHGNPEGRAKLDRAARIVGLVMVLVQAFGVATSLRALASSDFIGSPTLEISTPVVTASLVGGACITLLVADLVTRQGIVNGLLLLPCATTVIDLVVSARAAYAKAMFEGRWEPRHFVVLAGALALALFAGWAAVRRGTRPDAGDRAQNEKSSAYRDAKALVVKPTVPVPSSSIIPFTASASVLAIPAFLASFRLMGNGVQEALADTKVYYAAFVVVLVALTVLLTRLLHRPDDAEDLARRLGTSVDRKEIVAAQNRALLPTLAMFAVLVAATIAVSFVPSHGTGIGLAMLPLVAALAVDALGAVEMPDGFVGIWQERRALAAPVVCAMLEARGIATRVTGRATNAMLQAFAPYAPMTIYVATENAERAEKMLRHLLLGDEAPAQEPEDTPASDASKAAAGAGWTMRTRLVALAMALLVGCGLVGLGSMKKARVATGPRVPAKLEVVAVADRVDPFEDVIDAALTQGVEIKYENASDGISEYGQKQTRKVHFANVNLEEGESMDHAIARGEAFAKTIALPPGMRMVWEPTVDFDPDTFKETPRGARSFVIEGEPILTNRDILEAAVAVDQRSGMPEVYVAITLTPDAGERFRLATRQHVNQRIAIVLDGRVNSAPVVRTEIGGGRLSITMGAGDPDTQLKNAHKLADGLTQY